MNEKPLQELLTQLRDKTRSTLVPRDGCVPPSRLFEALSNDTLSIEETNHLAGCTICQRTAKNWRIASSYCADAAGILYDAATGEQIGGEAPIRFPEEVRQSLQDSTEDAVDDELAGRKPRS